MAPLLKPLAIAFIACIGGMTQSTAHTINSKSNSTPNIVVGGIATYTINVSSAGQSSASTGMTTVDTLPPGFAYRATRSITLANGATYSASIVPTPGTTTPQWGLFGNPNNSSTAGSPASSYSITFDADVLNPTCGTNVTNTANTTGGTQHAVLIPATNTAPLNITGPVPAMTVTKSTSTPVMVNSSSGMQAIYTIVVSNANGTCAATGVNITDTLPAGFTYASTGTITYAGTPASASRPSGTDPTVGAANPVWTGFQIPGGGSVSLTFVANIANGAANGSYYNNASATAAQTGATVGNFGPGAPVQLVAASLTKAFSPVSIGTGGNATLTFTITKPVGATATGMAFIEALPSNVTVSGTPTASQCGGTVSSTSTSITVSGATFAPASATCTITATVTSAIEGVYANTSSNVSGLAGGLSAAALNATLTVSNASLTKSFLTPVIGAGGASVMRLTLTNTTSSTRGGLGFTETLPSNVSVVSGFSASQCGGSVTSSGSQNVTLSGASLTASSSCNIDVTVTSSVPGSYVNGAAQISALSGGVTATGVNTTLTVRGSILTKSFNPVAIGVSGTSQLTFTINNTVGAPAQSSLSFIETLPAGVTRVAGFAASQCGGTVSSGGAQNISFSGGSLALGVSQCTINVNVTSSVVGTYANTNAQISGTSAGMDTSGVNASLTVGNVVLTKGFSDSPVNTNAVLVLTFTLTNSSGNPAQSGIGFTDTFPVGLTIANSTTTFGPGCAGTLTDSGGAALAAGGLGVRLTAATMTAGTASCNVSVNVTSATPGTYINNSTRISGASSGLGTGSVNATAQYNGATLAVTKSTTTPAVDIVGASNGVAIYTINVANGGNATASGITITDILPSGFTYASTVATTLNGGATRSPVTNPTIGATSPAWSTFSIPGGGSVVLTFSATIANATASGTYNNSTNVTTATSGTGITNYDGTLGANTAENVTVTRLADLTISKAQITPNPVSQGQTGVGFTLTVNNIGATAKTSPNIVTVTDSAPTGMTITGMSGTGWSCSIPSCTRSDALTNGASYPTITVTMSIASNAPSSATNGSAVSVSGQTESNTNNNTGSAPATIINPNVTLTKTSNPNPIGVNGVSTFTFTLTNGTGNPPQSNLAFTDTLPFNVVVASPANVVNGCGGTVSATPSSDTIALANGVLGAGVVSCAVSVQVTSAAVGNYLNDTGNISGLGGGVTAGGVNNTLVVSGSTLGKLFNPVTVGLGQISTLTFTVTNGTGNPAQSGLTFTDSFPSGLIVATPSGLTSTCGGTITAAPGSATVALSGGALAASTSSCSIAINVLSNAANVYTNDSARISGASTGMVTSGISSTLTVQPPLSVAKIFSPSDIPSGSTTVLTITLTNGNPIAVTSAALTDTYPSGLINSSSASAATTCTGGSVTASNGGNSLALLGSSVPANSSCTVTVNVTGSTPGSYLNSTGPITSANAGTATATNATLTVRAPPAIAKVFTPSSMAVGSVSRLTFTIVNTNNAALTDVSFVDIYPSGVVAASSPNLTNGCGGATTGGTSSATSITLSSGTVPANSSCVITVDVTANAAGTYNNLSANVSSINGGTGNTANATLVVQSKPSISKSMAPSSMAVNGNSILSLTITNLEPSSLTGVSFADAFPVGLSVSATPSLTNTCGGSISGGVAASTSISLGGGTLAANAACVISIAVTASNAGTLNNTASGVATNETGSAGAPSNVATLTVVDAPAIAKVFSPTVIGINGTSTLTFSLTNNSNVAQSGVAFSDSYPSGLINATSPTVVNGCGGTVTGGTSGGSTIGLTSATIPGNGTCTLSVNVSSAATGSYDNISGTISSSNGGVGNSASASLTVSANPSISKAFAPAIVPAGGTSTMTFVLRNTSVAPALSASFSDNFPTGMVVATPSGSANSCGGTLNAISGGGSIDLTGGTIPASGSCTVIVNVTAASAGSYMNTATAVASLLGSGSPSNAATLVVTTPLTISKAFTPNTILANGASTLSFSVTNPNGVPVTGANFNDAFPTGGLQVASTPNVTNSCGGTITGATSGSTSVSLVSGNLAGGATCTITVVVTSAVPASFNNTTSGVTSNQTTVGTAANATLLTVVAPDLTLSKSHSGNITVGALATYTLLVSNSLGTAPTSGVITVTDTLPTGLIFIGAGSGGSGWTCTPSGQVVSCTSSAIIAAGAVSSSAIMLNVNVLASAAPNVINNASVSGGNEPFVSTTNNAVSDSAVVVTAPQNTFAPDAAQTALPGTTVSYTHIFYARLAGSVVFGTTNTPVPVVAGWSNVLYRDTNCNGELDGSEGSSVLSGAVSVTPGSTVCVVVVEFVPAAAPYGGRDVITVAASFTPTSGPIVNYSRSDSTTVGDAAGAGLLLQKSVRNISAGGTSTTINAARPGDILEYTITYTNNGADPLNAIVVNDVTPAFTTFISAACSTPLPPNISACNVTDQPAAGGSGSLTWTLSGSLAPSAFGAVVFRVQL